MTRLKRPRSCAEGRSSSFYGKKMPPSWKYGDQIPKCHTKPNESLQLWGNLLAVTGLWMQKEGQSSPALLIAAWDKSTKPAMTAVITTNVPNQKLISWPPFPRGLGIIVWSPLWRRVIWRNSAEEGVLDVIKSRCGSNTRKSHDKGNIHYQRNTRR